MADPCYLDTSVLVAALGNERHTEQTQGWLAAQAATDLFVSDWGITEFSSALALKLRTGQIEAEHRAECLATFARLLENSLTILTVSSRDFRAAARLADHAEYGLRAGDALHLAVCAARGMRLITLDQALARAATALAVPARLL
ncbi:MAG: type II toxin-antitoxin system VapC family toxin [Wenzhouxiangella sp.]